jgi:hypothetical protein
MAMRLCGYMTMWLHDYVVPDSGAIHGYLTMTWLPDFVILWVRARVHYARVHSVHKSSEISGVELYSSWRNGVQMYNR